MAREFYLSILETSRDELAFIDAHYSGVPNTDFEYCDLKLGMKVEALTPIEDLKEVNIAPHIDLSQR